MNRIAFVAAVVTLAVAGAAFADGPADNLADKVRQIPPVGMELPDADRQAIQTALDALQGQLATLRERKDDRTRDFLPDVEIFARAVDQALRFGEFFNAGDVQRAKDLLDEGARRATALLDGQTPWATQTGLVVRGFRSRLDDTVQPYGLVIPESYEFEGASRSRCDLWFHGRYENVLELQFIAQRMTQRGQLTPRDTIVLHPFARFSNGNKLAGEVDSLEALDHAQRHYRIDPDRIAVRGFSMGGAACWHLAVHYADRWFAANPGAGFSETPAFLREFQKETLTPFWWEEKLWQLYDCPGWAANLYHCPTVAYSGEIDSQKQAADVMAEACDREGMRLMHVIGPQTAHKIHPDSAADIEARLDSLARVGRDFFPYEVRLVTYTLKYNRMHWLVVNGLEEHWKEARVYGSCPGTDVDAEIEVANVTDFTIDFPAGTCPLAVDQEPILLVNGQEVTGVRPFSDRSWRCRIYRDRDLWRVGDPQEEDGLRKRHDLQGPIDDALMDSFLFVKPSGKCRNEVVETWVQSELDRAVRHWRQQMRGDVRIKTDRDVTDDDMARHHLILWGDPQSNALLSKVADQLPIQWTAEKIVVGERSFDAAHHAPVFIYPNPLHPARYVVLNSSFTYREYDYLNNARQVPKLPDWAIIDLRTPPGPRWPGKVVEGDFFDERWQIKRHESLRASRTP